MKVDAKLVLFFQKNKFCLLKMEKNAFFRVRDSKGYGIWYKCGTCEPLQSRTSSKRTCQAERARSLNLLGFSSPHKLAICGDPKVMEGNYG